MRQINNCPCTLAKGYSTYSPTAIKRLFNGKKVSNIIDLPFNTDDINDEIIENITRISLSGVQEKHSAIIHKGKIILTSKGEQGRYIIKPIPSEKSVKYRQFIPANEHLTMQIARQVYGIDVAENGMIFFNDDAPAYITKRFDIDADGLKINQEDFASLIGKTNQINGSNFKYTGSYEDIANEIRKRVAAYPIELAKLFDLLIFNYLFGNNDAHLKNFSLYQTVDGDYVLTPAYDLLNASLHVEDSDFALEGGLSPRVEKSDIYLTKGHPCKSDFESFGELIGLSRPQIEKIVSKYLNEQSSIKVQQLIDSSYLDDRLQRMYRRSFDERMIRFMRG